MLSNSTTMQVEYAASIAAFFCQIISNSIDAKVLEIPVFQIFFAEGLFLNCHLGKFSSNCINKNTGIECIYYKRHHSSPPRTILLPRLLFEASPQFLFSLHSVLSATFHGVVILGSG